MNTSIIVLAGEVAERERRLAIAHGVLIEIREQAVALGDAARGIAALADTAIGYIQP